MQSARCQFGDGEHPPPARVIFKMRHELGLIKVYASELPANLWKLNADALLPKVAPGANTIESANREMNLFRRIIQTQSKPKPLNQKS